MNAIAKTVLDKKCNFDPVTRLSFINEHSISSAGTNIISSYSKTTECLWLTMTSQNNACFSSEMLLDLDASLHLNQQNYSNTKAIVLASANPKIFSFGNDLNYIRSRIIKYDRDALFQYIKLNLDTLFNFASHFQQLRIAQVTGIATDTGFELALASDVIIAERQATFCFSHSKLNLFPRIGSFYYLSRRVGPTIARQLLSSSIIYTAEQLAALGIVDVVVDKSCSTDAVINYIHQHQKYSDSSNNLKLITNRINLTPYSELLESSLEWLDTVMEFSGYELRQLERRVKLQNRASSKNIIN